MRLSHRTIRPLGRTITFRFDDRAIPALEGETIAAALSAAGIVAFRHTASGAPRGLHCGMGACFDCVVTVDGRIGQRACMTKAADGMAVTGERAAPLAPLGHEPTRAQAEERVCDVAGGRRWAGRVVGGDRRRGGRVPTVVVLDERSATGGQYAKPLADSHADAAPDAQFRLGMALRDRALAAGARIETDAMVWGGFAADEIAALVEAAR